MASVAASPPDLKSDLRAALHARRLALAPEVRRCADEAISARIVQWLADHDDACLGGYVAISGEADVSRSMTQWCDSGGKLCLPRVATATRPLEFLEWHPGAALAAGAHGTRQPTSDAPSAQPDVLLVPLVGFDKTGRRLGWGGGYYDRTLTRLRSAGHLTAIGVGYDVQEAEALPAEPWDQPLDLIVTETRMIEVTS